MPEENEGFLFKKGDVVWVRYRKGPLWPALIHTVYPKKITYVFFPLPELKPGKKPALFHCNPKNVYRVSVGEKTPSGSDQKLAKAVRSAKAYLAQRGRQEGSDAPLRPDSKSMSDDDEEDEEVVDDAPEDSKESPSEAESNEEDEEVVDDAPEDSKESPSEAESNEEDEEVVDDAPEDSKESPSEAESNEEDASECEEGEDDFEDEENGMLPLDGFTQTLEENYLSILDELFKEKMVRTYCVPDREDMQMSLAGSKFLNDDYVDILFQLIMDFIKEREEQCRILPAIHLASTVLFPEVITRVLMIYEGLEYEAAKLCVYSPENETESSVDTDIDPLASSRENSP